MHRKEKNCNMYINNKSKFLTQKEQSKPKENTRVKREIFKKLMR